MGLAKSRLFTEKYKQITAMAKAMAHPARIAILQHPAKINACIYGARMKKLGPARATISQHLKGLRAVRLIRGTSEGTSICCCIDPKVWNPYRKMFTTFFKEVAGTGCCC